MDLTLQTERLTLRLLLPEDAESIETLAGDREVADTTLNMPHPYPPGSAAAFIARRREAAEQGDGFTFAITLAETGAFLGAVGLHVNKTHNMAELGYWVGKPYWSKGYCTEAAARAVQFAFDELELNRLYAAAMTRNPASYKVMENIGMRFEGILRHHIRKGDVYEDLRYYGLLRTDVESIVNK
ncbi:GNAT family N-acetyltransferase [Paenibacillus pasadenensis]|uniref:GNAT family N-acetyltransferase n=1 Tax=Paenibacillus pasadenensis TaxID=217090 RepID=UPI00203FC4C1|nr:GNAT family N-acetyltransferase [Paenibacillus pasadenensis]MCM3748618.1 GNAT family N-acetyltransferase [Paenibacillus pasadenensis]